MKNPNQKHFQPMFDKIAKKNKEAAEKREAAKNGEIAELRNEVALLKAELKKLKK